MAGPSRLDLRPRAGRRPRPPSDIAEFLADDNVNHFVGLNRRAVTNISNAGTLQEMLRIQWSELEPLISMLVDMDANEITEPPTAQLLQDLVRLQWQELDRLSELRESLQEADSSDEEEEMPDPNGKGKGRARR